MLPETKEEPLSHLSLQVILMELSHMKGLEESSTYTGNF